MLALGSPHPAPPELGAAPHPSSGFEHLQVEGVPREHSLNLGQGVAGGHAGHKGRLDQPRGAGAAFRQEEAGGGEAGVQSSIRGRGPGGMSQRTGSWGACFPSVGPMPSHHGTPSTLQPEQGQLREIGPSSQQKCPRGRFLLLKAPVKLRQPTLSGSLAESVELQADLLAVAPRAAGSGREGGREQRNTPPKDHQAA